MTPPIGNIPFDYDKYQNYYAGGTGSVTSTGVPSENSYVTPGSAGGGVNTEIENFKKNIIPHCNPNEPVHGDTDPDGNSPLGKKLYVMG